MARTLIQLVLLAVIIGPIGAALIRHHWPQHTYALYAYGTAIGMLSWHLILKGFR